MVSLQNPPFSASSSWNAEVASEATYSQLNWPSSTGYNYTVSWDSYSPAVYVASESDPVVEVSYPAGWGYPAGTVSIHMPTNAAAANGTDGEMVVIDGDTAYSFWQFQKTGSSTASVSSFGSENVASGDGWGSKSPFLGAGTTAVGSSLLGGLVVQDETTDGSIDHALQLVVDSNLVKSGFTGDAIAGDGSSSSGIVQEGQLLAISPDTPMPSGLSEVGQQVFTALQNYGAYVVDVGGGATSIRVASNSFDDASMTALWQDMGSITPLLEAVSGGTTSSAGSTSSGSTGGTSSAGGTDTTDPSTGGTVTGSTGNTGGSSSGGTSSAGGTGTTDPTSGGTVTGSTGDTGSSSSGGTSSAGGTGTTDPSTGGTVTGSTGNTGSSSSGGTSSAGGTGTTDPTSGGTVTGSTGDTGSGSSGGTGSSGDSASATDPSTGDSTGSWGSGNGHNHSHWGQWSRAGSQSNAGACSDANLASFKDFMSGLNDRISAVADAWQGNTGGASTGSNLALLTQYAASSFAQSGPVLSGTSGNQSWADLAQTLTKPQASR